MSDEEENCMSWLGPYGRRSSFHSYRSWDDGVHSAVKKIIVSFSSELVFSVEVGYSDSGKDTVVFARKHGDSHSLAPFAEEIIVSPGDAVVSVAGCCSFRGGQQVKWLTFETARGKTYGPFGYKEKDKDEVGEAFCYKAGCGVRGFHGTVMKNRLSSIGIITGCADSCEHRRSMNSKQVKDEKD